MPSPLPGEAGRCAPDKPTRFLGGSVVDGALLVDGGLLHIMGSPQFSSRQTTVGGGIFILQVMYLRNELGVVLWQRNRARILRQNGRLDVRLVG